MELFFLIIKDGIFAAIAAIGFSSISNPSPRVFPLCALIAAAGHMTRYVLMNICGFQLASGSMLGALVIGFLALPAAKMIKTPAECISFPALLPMVPGMYAYRTIQSLMHCLGAYSEPTFMHYLYLLRFNWMTCMVTIIAMVVGALLPILLFKIFRLRSQSNGIQTTTLFRQSRAIVQLLRGLKGFVHLPKHFVPADKAA